MNKSDNQVLKCTYCQTSLGNNISIQCAKCIDINLCVKCFSMSAEIGEHKKEHDYKIRALQTCPFPIFDSDKLWSYKEENFLLSYIEQYGFGNWDEIAKNFETRSAQECMQHYFAYYIYGNIGKYSLNNGKPLQDKYNIDHTKDSDITVLLPPIEMSIEEQRALGYMPLRDDFEREFKNDGETLLSNLTINNDDDETDIDAKITLAKMYREILLDRQRLKKIAREYGLINNASALINKHRIAHGLEPLNSNSNNNNNKNLVNEQNNNKKRRRDDENSDINERFKKFAQLCNASIYETLIDNMRKRNQLITRIEELNKHRENGIRTFKEIDVYKEAKVKRENEKQQSTRKSSAVARRSPTLFSLPLKRHHTTLPITYRSTNDNIDDQHNNTTNLSCASSTSSSHDSNSVITNVSNYSSSIGSLDHNNLINRTGRSERLCSMPGYNLLSENEKKLVTTLKMKPALYVTFKTFLIKNSLARKRQLRASTILGDKSGELNDTNKNSSIIESTDGDNNNNNSSNTNSSMLLRKQNGGGIKKFNRLLNNNKNTKLFNSFPNYCNQIPRTTRKRIFRFLCDNGWIDI